MNLRQSGFSLLEILIAIVIMGLMAVLIVPQFGKKDKSQEQAFVAQMNKLMQTAWQQAVINTQVHKVLINFKERTISLEGQKTGARGSSPTSFAPVSGIAADTSMNIPASFIFANCFIDGKDVMRLGKRETAWFFIAPDGTAQPVVMNIKNVPSEEQSQEQTPTFGMVLNPFSAQFEYYDSAQKP